MEPVCKRCGQCCYYYDSSYELKKCLHLVQTGTKTSCRVYGNRLGQRIAKLDKGHALCIMRTDSPMDYPDCPYNTGKPLFSKEEVARLRKELEDKNGNHTNDSSL